MRIPFTIVLAVWICSIVFHPNHGTAQSYTRSVDIEPNSTIVFLGDSITYQAHYCEYVRSFFDTRYPQNRIRFINSGIPGHRAADAIVRFERDVARWKPDLVLILFGMNDGGYQSLDTESRLPEYQRNMQTLLNRISAMDAEPVLLGPTPFDFLTSELRQQDEHYRFKGKDFASDYDLALGYYAGWCNQLATQTGIAFVNNHSVMNEYIHIKRLSIPTFTLMPDAIHPDPAGHLMMAHTLLKRLEPTRHQVFRLDLRRTNTDWNVNAEQIATRNLQGDASRVSFDCQLQSLPWRIPERHTLMQLRWNNPSNAMEMENHLSLASEINLASLRIHGLNQGIYELECDGLNCGHFDQTSLANGINLDRLRELPWSQQANEIASLNRQISDEVVRPIQDIATRRYRLLTKDGNELKKFDQANREKIDQLEQNRDELREKIRIQSVPQWHKITISRIEKG